MDEVRVRTLLRCAVLAVLPRARAPYLSASVGVATMGSGGEEEDAS